MQSPNKNRLPLRWITISFFWLVIFGLQFGMESHKWELPFLDHSIYNGDNTLFTSYSRNGIVFNEPKTQLGLTMLQYKSWGKPSGRPTFYTHHPFLFKALFQQYVRVFGDAEWVSRSFAFGVASIATSGFYLGLIIASESALAAFLGTFILISIPVFALFQTAIKYEIDGMAAGSWFFVAVALYLRRPSLTRLACVTALAALSAMSHWTALIFVGATVVWMAWEWARNRDHSAGKAALSALLGSVAGTAAVIATFAWLKGGWAQFYADIFEVAASRSDITEIPPGEWSRQQVEYVVANFGKLLPGVVAILAISMFVKWGRDWLKDKTKTPGCARDHLLPAFFFCTLATACVWQFVFCEGSYDHNYWQLWFCIPIAGLIAMGIKASRASLKALRMAVILTVVLGLWLQVYSHQSYQVILNRQIGTPQDIQFIKSLRQDVFTRFVYIPTLATPINLWSKGKNFDYYTDRGLEGYVNGMTLELGDKVLLPLAEDQGKYVELVEKGLHVELMNTKCSQRLCAYDVVKR